MFEHKAVEIICDVENQFPDILIVSDAIIDPDNLEEILRENKG